MTPKSNEIYTNGWSEWSKHVLMELERLNDKSEAITECLATVNSKLSVIEKEVESVKKLEEKVNSINVEIATIKLRFSMIGAAIGGGIAVLVQLASLLIQYIKG